MLYLFEIKSYQKLSLVFLFIFLYSCSHLTEYTDPTNSKITASFNENVNLKTFNCDGKKYKAHLTRNYLKDNILLVALNQKIISKIFKVDLAIGEYADLGNTSFNSTFLKKKVGLKFNNKLIVINYEDLVYFQDPHGHALFETKLCTHFWSDEFEPDFKKVDDWTL